MNVKHLLAKAINAHVAGDAEAVSQALKQAVAQKTRNLVNEAAPNAHGIVNWWENDTAYFGPYDIELSEGEVANFPAGPYEIIVSADAKQYGRNTRGNFSSRAADPDEYYGEEAEYELTIEAIQLFEAQDDQAIAELEGPAAAALVPEHVCDLILAEIKQKWEREADDHPSTY